MTTFAPRHRGGAAPPERLRRLAVVASLLGLSSCSDPSPGRSVDPPAAPGGGQPHLAPAGEGAWMSWTEPTDDGHRVALSFFDGEWGPVSAIARGRGFFVNWADFPSVEAVGDRLAAHWLQRGGRGTYDYGIRVAFSGDRGATWSEPWIPHEDETPTEHGFASIFAWKGEAWMVWLDGRAMVDEGGPMAVRSRRLLSAGADAAPGPELVVDDRSCECCQTDAAVAGDVPVAVFRDRGEGEVRDVHASRFEADASGRRAWSASAPVHRDGWVVGGCPVNGPALAARGDDVAVAWFTAPNGEPRVRVAFSDDGAVSFSPPLRVDAGHPLGRVDVAMLDDGSAIATWLERSGSGGGASIASRRVASGGEMGDVLRLAPTQSARAAGFPRIARLGADRLMLAWTDASQEARVRAMVVPASAWDAPGR